MYMFYNKEIVTDIPNLTPTEPLETASGVEGVTNREYDAVMGLIDSETGVSDVRNSVGGAQRFNRIVTQAIFGSHGNDKWDHNGHFNRAKAVILAMVGAGKLEPVYDDKFAIVGIKLPTSEVSLDDPDTKIDPRGLLLTSLVGKLATAAEELAAETAYHAAADEMIGPLSDENDRLTAENTALREQVYDLQHSPREAEMQAELDELRRQLAAETAAREAAERRVESLKLSLTTARDQLKKDGSVVRQKDRTIKDLNNEISDLHLGAREQTERAFADGHTEGWKDGVYMMWDILSVAGYSDHSAQIVYALAYGDTESITDIYNTLNRVLSLSNQIHDLDEGKTKSVTLSNGAIMQASTQFQIESARTQLLDELTGLRFKIRQQIEDMAASMEIPSEHALEDPTPAATTV